MYAYNFSTQVLWFLTTMVLNVRVTTQTWGTMGQEWVARGPRQNSTFLPKNQAKFSLSVES